MTRKRAFLMALAALALAGSLAAQTREEAKADGKAFAAEAAKKAREAASTPPDASRIPNFDAAGTRALENLADDPDRIEGAARSAASGHAGYRAMQDSVHNRAAFDPQTIRDVLSRSVAIGENPLDYTSGMAVTGSQGTCVPLPPGTGSAGTYTATCNTGVSGELRQASCTIPLAVTFEERTTYRYYASVPPRAGPAAGIDQFGAAIDGGTCQNLGPADTCQAIRDYGLRPTRDCGRYRTDIVQCSAPVPGLVANTHPNTGQHWFAREITRIPITARDESQCAAVTANATCSAPAETCTDSEPQTRVIDGVPVTAACWAWRRDYECLEQVSGNDCDELEANVACRFVREECLSGEEPCLTRERVYECPLPAGENGPEQYVCDGDVYCIDGSCETIVREANNEFKDAVTALHAMDEARGQFDPETLTLFKGTRNTCSSKVFGVLNCCKGKGFPLIPGISLLVAMGCDRAEVLLHERDAQGLCAYVGTYCSDSFLGACLTKKKVYCCFESKLSRILQEQGRAQLPKPWGKPKTETCAGFTLDEFARLDLSRMDFSEVYAEFTEAARLPDELETSALIQQKIEDYYDRSGQ